MSKIRSLHILESVKIESPCYESWDNMLGDSKQRHCDKCMHSVTNLSSLTQEEALRVLENQGEQRLCVRYQIKTDGNIKFKSRNFILQQAWSYASIIVTTLLAMFGVSSHGLAQELGSPVQTAEVQEQVLLGEIAPSPTPAPTPKAESETIKMGKMVIVEKKTTKTPRSCQTKMDR